MIPHGVEIFLGVEPIDLRWGFDRLAGIVGERLGRPARSGALFVFRGRRGCGCRTPRELHPTDSLCASGRESRA
jgi:transposase